MKLLKALAFALLLPLALAACLFMPGKFESTLDIRADRNFTFTYKGEVAAIDLEGLMGKAMKAGMAEGMTKSIDDSDDGKDETPASAQKIAFQDTPKKMPDLKLTPEEMAKRDERYREIAEKVAKEAGFRTVEYRGNSVFYVDYAITGKLTHGFLWPYNQDVQMVLPFVAVELRGKDAVRVKAQGFATQGSSGFAGTTMPGAAGAQAALSEMLGIGGTPMNGTFTLTTNAEIVSQNNEDGASNVPAGKAIPWKVTTTTKDAPMATLRVVGLQ